MRNSGERPGALASAIWHRRRRVLLTNNVPLAAALIISAAASARCSRAATANIGQLRLRQQARKCRRHFDADKRLRFAGESSTLKRVSGAANARAAAGAAARNHRAAHVNRSAKYRARIFGASSHHRMPPSILSHHPRAENGIYIFKNVILR